MLQYLGFFAFRAPVPAYKHAAAMFLKLRGWVGCDEPTRKARGGRGATWKCCGTSSPG